MTEDLVKSPGNLIIDIGAHNGDDSAYYLHRGYDVVAVEANPVLVDRLRQRFSNLPVRVENVCVGPANSQSVTFWVNQANSTWSSFDRELAARDGTLAIPVEVPSVTMGTLLERYGAPYYLKIDIEGMDQECLRSIDASNIPRYISLELSHGEDIIDNLSKLGYSRFKVINQGTFTTSTPTFSRELGWRLLRKMHLSSLIRDGIKCDFDAFPSRFDWHFNEGCSGPFGEETFGPWISAEGAKRLHEHVQNEHVRGCVPLSHCWYDVHATGPGVGSAD